MRRIVVIIPELLSLKAPILDGEMPHLKALAERSTVFRVGQLEDVETPETRWLGMSPTRVALRQGPLTIAALGADPPPRSLHFHLSLLGIEDGAAYLPSVLPTAEESRAIVEAAEKLNTRLLTFVAGNGLDHGIVWEMLGDLGTTPAQAVVGSPIKNHLPLGDGEPMLRQYIDDSVNLLSELELNQRRIDEGQPSLNLLWPWGHGVRMPVPNLALQRAAPAVVLSNSLRLAGLSRLAGYRHLKAGWLGYGLQTRLEEATSKILGETSSILVLDVLQELRAKGELDEAAYVARRIDSEMIAPILEFEANEAVRLLVLSPSDSEVGLGLSYDSKQPTSSIYPFDERSIDEKALPVLDAESAVDQLLRPDEH